MFKLYFKVLFVVGVAGWTCGQYSPDYSPAVSYVNMSSFAIARSISNSGGENRLSGGGSNSPHIIFPQGTQVPPSHGSKVPLDVLMALSSETDFAEIVRKFVGNVDIVKVEGTGELILVGHEGQPFTDVNGEKIVVSSVSSLGSTPFITTQPAREMNQSGPATRMRGNERTSPISPRFGPTLLTAEKPPSVAVCRPEHQTVEIPVNFEPHIISYPRCVRVERCGGCCGSDILACEPTQISTVNVLVRKLAYNGERNSTPLEFVQQVQVPLIKHNKCECRCRVKEEDCGSRQVYLDHDCLCVCRNENEKHRCLEDNEKTWDPVTCDCACREIKDCNSGYLFDLGTCQCIQIHSTQRRRRRNHTKPKIQIN